MNLRRAHSETSVKQGSGFDLSFVYIGGSTKVFPDFVLSIVVLVMSMFVLLLQSFAS